MYQNGCYFEAIHNTLMFQKKRKKSISCIVDSKNPVLMERRCTLTTIRCDANVTLLSLSLFF